MSSSKKTCRKTYNTPIQEPLKGPSIQAIPLSLPHFPANHNIHLCQWFESISMIFYYNYNFAFASVHVCSAGCRKTSSLRICSWPSWYGFSTWATPATAWVKSSTRVNDMVGYQRKRKKRDKERERERKSGTLCVCVCEGVKKDKRDEFPRTEHFLFVLFGFHGVVLGFV